MNKINLVILNVPDYPFGYAVVEKFKQINKIFIENGDSVRIINRHPVVTQSLTNSKYYAIGRFNGTTFINTLTKTSSRIIKYLTALYGLYLELILIKKFAKRSYSNVIMISYDFFPFVIYYSIIAKLFNYKLVISIMEYHAAINYNSVFKNINAKLFDRYSFYFADKTIVISNKLSELIKEKYPQHPVFKLPVLADFDYKNNSIKENEFTYLLYCGNIGYAEVIKFILSVWDKIKNKTKLNLKLILHGNRNKVNKLITEIKEKGLSDTIDVKSNLSIKELYNYYYNSYAFLAPLRPTQQDEYRFPQKIAEFSSIKRPIITTNFGEIKNYFRDKETAFIADSYDIESFSEKILEAINNPILAEQVGINAFELGKNNFYYKNYKASLKTFLNDIKSN